jgi:apolipoprotein N-acyltransferase
LKVALVQGNVPQDLKFGVAVPQSLADYRKALLANTADFIALPETALPVLADNLPEHFWGELKQHFAQNQQLALIGIPMREAGPTAQGQLTNSAMALMPSATDANYRYDKHHLVPFGEFVPLMFRWFVDLMRIPLGSFGRGALGQPLLEFKGERIATNICYEDLFGEELAQNFSDPQHSPTLMINLSNIAWFGNTVAIDQHLHISRVRAMELGRPMLRATNTGATAIIDAQGVVTHRLASGVQGVLSGEVKGVHSELTPYTQWASKLGLFPMWFLGFAAVFTVAGLAHRARHGRRRFAT